MVDTGETARASQPGYFPRWHPYFRLALQMSVTPEQEIGPALRGVGIEPGDVRWVVLTHMHTDHAGGLAQFPDSEVLVTRTEYETASGFMGKLRGYLPDRVAPGVRAAAARSPGRAVRAVSRQHAAHGRRRRSHRGDARAHERSRVGGGGRGRGLRVPGRRHLVHGGADARRGGRRRGAGSRQGARDARAHPPVQRRTNASCTYRRTTRRPPSASRPAGPPAANPAPSGASPARGRSQRGCRCPSGMPKRSARSSRAARSLA